jgi:hypothetical protein
MSSSIQYQCKICGHQAHVVEQSTNYYCAPCVLKRDNIPYAGNTSYKKDKKIKSLSRNF